MVDRDVEVGPAVAVKSAKIEVKLSSRDLAEPAVRVTSWNLKPPRFWYRRFWPGNSALEVGARAGSPPSSIVQ